MKRKQKFDIEAELKAKEAREALAKGRTVSDLRAMVKALDRDLTLSEARLEAMLALDSIRDELIIKPRKKSAGGEAMSVTLATDWHFEEAVDRAKVSGVNEFNVKIADASITNFFQNQLRLVELNRHGRDISKHVLVLGGDFFSGHIHEDLVEATAMSPTESVLWLEERIASGIRYLLEHGDFEKLVVPCVVGNHGRTTVKMRIQNRVKHSYEWLMYNHLARHFANEPTVEFSIAEGYHLWLDVGGYRVRIHHGDEIRYGGGVGGITIPVNKAIAQWNTARRADLDVFGHYHQLIWGPQFVANGSLIGYAPFSVACKGAYETPSQAFFLIDPKYRARTVCAPIRVRTQ